MSSRVTPAASTPARTRLATLGASLRAPLRQPLVQFVLLGLLITLAAHAWQASHDRHVIHLTTAVRQQIARHYQQQFGAPPDAAQLDLLIRQYVRDEIFLREALALRLDQNDEIVRRRLVQKFEFLQTVSTPQAPPDEADLAHWFAAHRAQYQAPATVAFRQLYFSPDQGGEAAAERRAHAALETLRRPTRTPQIVGDPFPGPLQAADLSSAEAQRLFGASELTEQLFHIAPGAWQGPYRSGYGWHLVFVVAQQPATDATLAPIRARVLADYLTERQQQTAARAYDALRSHYVIQEGP